MQQIQAARHRPSRIVLGFSAVVLAFIALWAWALSSPMGSSPDDNYHLASVWCGDGPREGICDTTAEENVLAVPKLVYESPGCFAFHAENSAACQDLDFAASGYMISNVSVFNNSDRLYPPLFYAASGLFVTTDPISSLWSIRLFNAAIAVLGYAALFILLPRKIKHLPVWAITATAVPLSMFIIPSNNPSSWAVTGSGIVLFSMIGFYLSEGRRRILLALMAVVGALLMAGSRADAAIYAGIAVVAAMIISARKQDLTVRGLWLPILISIVSIGFFLTSNQVGSASGGLTGAADPSLTTATLIIKNVLMMPLLWLGVFGSTGLGWLDTAMPETAWMSSFAAFVVLIVSGFYRMSRKVWIAGILVLAALWIFPTYILVKSKALVGVLVQPRYMLPLIVILAGVLIYRTNGKKFDTMFIRILGIAGILLLAAANALSLHRNIKRYVTGVDVSGWNLDASAEWWWNIPVSPMFTWAIGSVAFFGFLVALYLLSPMRSIGVSFDKTPNKVAASKTA